MRCWILYDEEDLKENAFFAGRLRDEGLRLGMDCSIVLTSEADAMDAPDAVVARMRDPGLSERLESAGSIVFNPSRVSRICNDKDSTYRFADSLGVPFLPYVFPGDVLPDGPPWVVKSCVGHGGTEVFLAESEDEASEACRRLEGRKPIVQQMAPVKGRDMRVYVLGGKVLAAVLRSSDTDFRANFKLGGRAEIVDAPSAASEILERLVPELDADLVGIDFLFGEDGKVFLNEIEDVVGTRMLYSLTGLDPAALLMRHVHSKISL